MGASEVARDLAKRLSLPTPSSLLPKRESTAAMLSANGRLALSGRPRWGRLVRTRANLGGIAARHGSYAGAFSKGSQGGHHLPMAAFSVCLVAVLRETLVRTMEICELVGLRLVEEPPRGPKRRAVRVLSHALGIAKIEASSGVVRAGKLSVAFPTQGKLWLRIVSGRGMARRAGLRALAVSGLAATMSGPCRSARPA